MSARRTDNVTREMAINTAITRSIDFRPYASGSIKIPDAWTSANIGFKVGEQGESDGTFDPLYDHDGNLVEIANAANVSRQYELPPEIFGCAHVQIWSQNSGSDANQAAARTLILTLKS